MSIYQKLKIKVFMHSVKCIVWDYDGTLYNDQNGIIGQQINKIFFEIAKKYNHQLTLKQFEKKSNSLGSWADAANFYTHIPLIKLMNQVGHKFNKEKYIKSNPQIVNLIESNKNRFIHLILTNSTQNEVLRGLKKIGFNKNPFKKIFSRDTTNLLKPNKILFDQIQSLYHLKKKNILFIGDSIKNDIQPARELKFKAIPIWDVNRFLKP